MNYIGSKLSLLPFLEKSICEIAGKNNKIFCDLFAGTGIVGRHFKKQGYTIIANDLQYYSYVLNRHYIGNCRNLSFNNLRIDNIFEFMNTLSTTDGFIYKNYAGGSGTKRLYFSDTNAQKCDAIRQQIEQWHIHNLITDDEYFFLLASLLECIDKCANTASVYAAFLKKLKASATKNFQITPTECIFSNVPQFVFNKNANELIKEIKTDILYLDPPYNERQYASNYHILETIAKYDNPDLRGKTGMRNYDLQKSDFCRRSHVARAFADIIQNAKAKYIFLSYNNEGLMSFDEIRAIMSRRGKYGCFTQPYSRFKADKKRSYLANSTTEYLHWVVCDN